MSVQGSGVGVQLREEKGSGFEKDDGHGHGHGHGTRLTVHGPRFHHPRWADTASECSGTPRARDGRFEDVDTDLLRP